MGTVCRCCAWPQTAASGTLALGRATQDRHWLIPRSVLYLIPDNLEEIINHVTFDAYARRVAALLDRRSLLGGLSGALLTTGAFPVATESKKGKGCKKRVKLCKSDLRDDICEGNNACINDLNKCCKKACNSLQNAIDCCENAGWCL